MSGFGSLQLSGYTTGGLPDGALGGNDVLAGNFGNDILRGADGTNIYVGNGGNDIFILGLEDDFNSEVHGSNQDGSGGAGEKNTIAFRSDRQLKTELITDIDVVKFAAITGTIADFSGANLGGLSGKLHVIGDANFNGLWFHSGGAHRDVINDFQHGQDVIDLIDLIDLDGSSKKGFQHFKFIGEHNFHHKRGELHYKAVDADTVLLSGDRNGDGKADFQVLVHGVGSLTDDDLRFDLLI